MAPAYDLATHTLTVDRETYTRIAAIQLEAEMRGSIQGSGDLDEGWWQAMLGTLLGPALVRQMTYGRGPVGLRVGR